METQLFMFNSKKEFWNPVTRIYQKEPYSMTEADMLLTQSIGLRRKLHLLEEEKL